MTIETLLNEFKKLYGNQRDKGTSFEKLIKSYLLIEPKYSNLIEKIWMWSDFPYRNNVGDTGIDLVARTYDGEFWAIQCKFYEENHSVSKSDVDTFLATSSKMFDIDGVKTSYSYRLIVSTTDKYSSNAEDVLLNQNPPVGRIGLIDLLESNVDWEKFSVDKKITLKEKYDPRPHQRKAIDDIKEGFKSNNRGKLIMACGTGKTFTSLRAVEEILNGKGNVLFLVPSIALISQTMSEWTSQCNYSYEALVVCSDNKASKGDSSIDLGIPSTTDIEKLCKWCRKVQNNDNDMHFVFSTYQSIDCVSEFQAKTDFKFDIIVCDEAHRTTGVTLSDTDESYFVKVHDNNFILADKRLYMTATPRIYTDNIKNKAKDVKAELCSMDDESKYGPIFHNLTFSDAVSQNLLTDYKVLVLAVDEEYVKKELQVLLTDENHEIRLDDSVKIMGCWNGLSKKTIEVNNDSFESDPIPMKRAVAFCNKIKDSKTFVEMFKLIQNHIRVNDPKEAEKLVNIEVQHVDGSFNALEKKEKINWLKEDTEDTTCRILTNARCLSEGVDVPALDAVMFLNPRSSMVDIIQSVGRVMRKSPGKKYGYVMLPIGIPVSENPYDALDNNEKYQIVWSVLQALRAHDDRFNNTINKIELNKKKPDQINVLGIGKNKVQDSDEGKKINNKNRNDFVQIALNLDTLEEWRDSIYAKMVKKVGSRRYWESWARDVAQIAQAHIDRINILLDKHEPHIDKIFNDFVVGLQNNLNSSITAKDAIEMLAQHMITKPVFDALFEGYEFIQNNPVSKSMQEVMNILDKQLLDSEKEKLKRFYESVRERAKGIDNAEGKQKIVIELYDKFFRTALPKDVEKLGITYTPYECVDFIIYSVEQFLNKEFNISMSNRGVHIIDGFTGTGTFIVRLLQSGIVKKEDLLYKYTNEIHANEIVLLAYYIAAINIEETFHDLSNSKNYIPFEGIVLTDTFQLYEDYRESAWTKMVNEMALPQNSERAKKQRDLPITICISNPPWSIGQKSANDEAQNLDYKKLDEDINNSYAKYSKANLKRGLYDNYIRAFRWATNRIDDRGIIGFITNGSYIDNQGMDGFRKCLLDEFTGIYVFNLRGNQRTSGETSKKEGGKIFGSGSRTPVAITFLVKNPNKNKDGYIHYCDIGDYLSRDDKLKILKEKHDVSQIQWEKIYPDNNNDWLNKKSEDFNYFDSIAPKNKHDLKTKSIFTNYIIGAVSSRDSWVYNYSKSMIAFNVNKMLDYYNSERLRIQKQNNEDVKVDTTKISWSQGLKNKAKNNVNIVYNNSNIVKTVYRPYVKQLYYNDSNIIERPGKASELFLSDNLIICVSGIGANKLFSCLMLNSIPCLDTIEKSQCFPLYWYEKTENDIKKHDGISDCFLKKCIDKYNVKTIDKESIFYYVYGFLHSNDYRNKFSADLKKSLPKIQLVDSYEDFILFSENGRKLADLHLNYEKVEPYKCEVLLYEEDYTVSKIKFGKGKDKSTIIFNNSIQILDIPERAYRYIINGKSAIEWIIDRYQIKIDKKSGIKNDPNDWCKEVGDEKYIFNLLLRIINVSVQTVDIIDALPKLDFNQGVDIKIKEIQNGENIGVFNN